MSDEVVLGKDPQRQGVPSYEQSFKHERHPFDEVLAKQAVAAMKQWMASFGVSPENVAFKKS